MGTSSSAIFTGSSSFSQDFQSVIDRSVAIASVPLQQLSNDKAKLNDQSSVLGTLNTNFTALQTAMQNLQTSQGGYTADVSDKSIVKATAGTGASAGTFTLEVVNLGSYTTTMSKSGLTTVSDPSTQNISSSSSYTLTVNGNPFTVTPASGTLSSLVHAINSTAGANVRASLVNVGSSSAPDYRLSLQSTKVSADTISLDGGSGNVLDTLATGENASYKVNGLTTAIQSDSRTVTLAPGVTAQLLTPSTPGVATTIDVSLNSDGIRTALSSLADAYNAVVNILDQQHGKNAGSLGGSSIVNTLQSTLRNITSYTAGTGSVRSLADLGLNLGADGKLTLDSTQFDTATANGTDAIVSFLGDSTSGFLQTATDALNSVEDPTKGTLPGAIQNTQQQITAQDALIQANQDRVDQLRQRLTDQMARADALVSSLQQQVDYMNNLFASMKIDSQSYN